MVDPTPPAPTQPATTVVDSTIPGDVDPVLRQQVEQLQRPLRLGDRGVAVVVAQAALVNLGYDAGSSGEFDERMQQAVWAFEGLALERPWQQQTGELTSDEILRLMEGEFAPPRPRRDDPHHTEILLDRQVLVVYRSGMPRFIAHISSGSGEAWCETQTVDVESSGEPLPQPRTQDVCGVANTPGGVFQFSRKVDGRVLGDYGGMLDPVYFNYGIAVHGALNVPGAPGSHGGVRIPAVRSAEFRDVVDLREYVYVFDGVTEPEQVAADRQLPTFNYPNPDATPATTG